MLSNRFPDASAAPDYNTVDATLWYVEAIRAYHVATGDDALLKELYPVTAHSFLAPLADHVADYGIGSIAEIFDGDPPFTPNGCIAQAWSVAETLQAWHSCLGPDARSSQVHIVVTSSRTRVTDNSCPQC